MGYLVELIVSRSISDSCYFYWLQVEYLFCFITIEFVILDAIARVAFVETLGDFVFESVLERRRLFKKRRELVRHDLTSD